MSLSFTPLEITTLSNCSNLRAKKIFIRFCFRGSHHLYNIQSQHAAMWTCSWSAPGFSQSPSPRNWQNQDKMSKWAREEQFGSEEIIQLLMALLDHYLGLSRIIWDPVGLSPHYQIAGHSTERSDVSETRKHIPEQDYLPILEAKSRFDYWEVFNCSPADMISPCEGDSYWIFLFCSNLGILLRCVSSRDTRNPIVCIILGFWECNITHEVSSRRLGL